MKNRIFKITAIIVSLALICSIPVSSTAGESYPDFGTYVLLGDSVASGYNDLTDTDTEFTRIDYSYGAIVADTIGAEYIPMACPGFRTIEMRYMLEDGFEGDDYLFHDAIDGGKTASPFCERVVAPKPETIIRGTVSFAKATEEVKKTVIRARNSDNIFLIIKSPHSNINSL